MLPSTTLLNSASLAHGLQATFGQLPNSFSTSNLNSRNSWADIVLGQLRAQAGSSANAFPVGGPTHQLTFGPVGYTPAGGANSRFSTSHTMAAVGDVINSTERIEQKQTHQSKYPVENLSQWRARSKTNSNFSPKTRRAGKWNDTHARIAWTVYNLQRQKALQDKTKQIGAVAAQTDSEVTQANISNDGRDCKEILPEITSAFDSFKKSKLGDFKGARERTTGSDQEGVESTSGNIDQVGVESSVKVENEASEDTHNQWKKVIPGKRHTTGSTHYPEGERNSSSSLNHKRPRRTDQSQLKKRREPFEEPAWKRSKMGQHQIFQPTSEGTNLESPLINHTGANMPRHLPLENTLLENLLNHRAAQMAQCPTGQLSIWNRIDNTEPMTVESPSSFDPATSSILNIMAENERAELARRLTLQRDINTINLLGFSSGSLGLAFSAGLPF